MKRVNPSMLVRKKSDLDIKEKIKKMLREPQIQVRPSSSIESELDFLIRKLEKCRT